MRNPRHRIWTLPLLLMMLLIGGCGSHSTEPDEPEQWNPDLRLLLRVYTADSGSPMSRAITDPDRYEYPTLDTEKLQTLRVIIVNDQTGDAAKGTVVHNCIENLTYLANNYTFRTSFKVEFGTKYKVYLIGNEKGITGIPNVNTLLTTTLGVGTTYPEDCLENLVMSVTNAGDPLIDNDTASDPLPVPVTESYEITTMPRPQTEAQTVSYTEERRFFLTRTSSKFSFHLFRAAEWDEEDDDLHVKAIRMTGLGNNVYLFPPATTVYSPSKMNAQGEVDATIPRYISSFTLPAGAVTGAATGTHDFNLTSSVSLTTLPVYEENGTSIGEVIAPQLYFPESKGDNEKFTCSISYDGVNFLPPQELPKLSVLPRNTFVKVYIIISHRTFTVSVRPYTAITLEPDFGILPEESGTT